MMTRVLTDREVNIILHALRKLQDPNNCVRCCEHFDEEPWPSEDEIEALAEQIGINGVTVEFDPE